MKGDGSDFPFLPLNLAPSTHVESTFFYVRVMGLYVKHSVLFCSSFVDREAAKGGIRQPHHASGIVIIAIEKVIGDMLSKVIPTYVRARRPTHCLLQFLIKSGDISREQFGDCVSFHVVCRLLLPSPGSSDQQPAQINRDVIPHEIGRANV